MELPEKPTGYTKRLEIHYNFGSKGGMGVYRVFAPGGAHMPFGMQYDTRKGGLNGFTHRDHDGVMTWAELREFMKGR
jgi:hypothetical protein